MTKYNEVVNGSWYALGLNGNGGWDLLTERECHADATSWLEGWQGGEFKAEYECCIIVPLAVGETMLA